MKCPHCDANIPVLRILFAWRQRVTCHACKRQLQIRWQWPAFVGFLILGPFVGIPYPNDSSVLLLVSLIEIVGLYSVMFYMFVCLAVVNEPEKPRTR